MSVGCSIFRLSHLNRNFYDIHCVLDYGFYLLDLEFRMNDTRTVMIFICYHCPAV